MFRKTRAHVFPAACLAIILSLTLPSSGQNTSSQSQVPSRITALVDNGVRTAIAHSTHPFAQAKFDRGPVDPGTALNRMILVLGVSGDQDHQLRTLLDSQQTKGSPDYHHWLTPEEFGQKYGPSPQDVQQVAAWLKQQGFTVGSVAKSARWIEFSGTAGQVNQAFQTEMRNYQVEGRIHTANSRDLTIPSALSPVVLGVASLHDFYSKPMHRMYHPDANVPLFGGPQQHAIAPADLAKIYDLGPLYSASLNGAGETIAIVAASNINTIANNGVDDVATFRSLFGLPATAPNIILNGPDPGVDTQLGIGFEATLDVEWSGAVAPNATIDLVVSSGSLTTDPIVLGSSFIVDQNLAAIMNVSFGLCEAQLSSAENAFWSALWQQAAAQGISVFVASGDSGAAGCDAAGESLTAAVNGLGISGFASTQFNTAVGGTEFFETVTGGVDSVFWNETPNTLSSANGYIPEMVWNDSCTPTQANTVCPQLPPAQGQFLILGGGGGVSLINAIPSYQTLSVPGLSALNSFTLPGTSTHPRGIPDISLDAAVQHDPYLPCFTTVPATPDCQLTGGQVTANTFQNPAGGTSFASPEFAGIMAIVDQKLGGRQGLANYVLYSLAANKETFSNCNSSTRITPGATTCIFNDITAGTNGMPGNDISNDPTTGALGFPATTGFDLGTGLGSVDANNLVTQWGNATFTGTQTTLSSTSGASINITHGSSVQFTVNVQKAGGGAGPSTGNVAVITNETAPGGGAFAVGAGALSGGSFTGSFNNLPGGSYNVTANYPGDGTFAGSTSNAIPATVAAENTTTVLHSFVLNLNTGLFSTSNTIAYGDPANVLFLDADTQGLSGLLPSSGSVTFTIGGNKVTPIAIDNSGIGEYIDCFFPQVTCLTPGTYTVSATYSGDGPLSYNGSSSTSSISITVAKGPAAATLTAPGTASAGQQFTVSAQVQSTGFGTVTPMGTVQFFDGATALGSAVTLSGGQASMQVTLNSSGNHSLTASYSGDSTYNAATSAPSTVVVTAPFTFNAPNSSQTIAAGGTATYNITVNGVGGFSGAVNFTCTGAPGGSSCTISPNPANLSASTTSIPLTVTVSNTANALLVPSPFRTLPVFAVVFAGLLLGVRKKSRNSLLMVLALGLILGLVSCGGGGSTPPITKAPTLATLTVTGTSGTATNTINLSLTITH